MFAIVAFANFCATKTPACWITTHQNYITTFNGDVAACSNCDPNISLRHGGDVIYAIAQKCSNTM